MSKKVIKYDDLIKLFFGEDDYPDIGTPAYDIRESELVFRVPLEVAKKLMRQMVYMI